MNANMLPKHWTQGGSHPQRAITATFGFILPVPNIEPK